MVKIIKMTKDTKLFKRQKLKKKKGDSTRLGSYKKKQSEDKGKFVTVLWVFCGFAAVLPSVF